MGVLQLQLWAYYDSGYGCTMTVATGIRTGVLLFIAYTVLVCTSTYGGALQLALCGGSCGLWWLL